jgi:hypothetical protein
MEMRGYNGIAGFAEKWLKRASWGQRDELDHATWVEVDKTTWRDRSHKLAIVRVDDEEWWTIVMPDRRPLSKPAAKWMLDHADALADAMSCSFPAWLLHRQAIHAAAEAREVDLAGQAVDRRTAS